MRLILSAAASADVPLCARDSGRFPDERKTEASERRLDEAATSAGAVCVRPSALRMRSRSRMLRFGLAGKRVEKEGVRVRVCGEGV